MLPIYTQHINKTNNNNEMSNVKSMSSCLSICYRRIPDTLYDHVSIGGHTALPHRAGHGTAHAPGRSGSVEYHTSLAGRHRHLLVHCDAVCGVVL